MTFSTLPVTKNIKLNLYYSHTTFRLCGFLFLAFVTANFAIMWFFNKAAQAQYPLEGTRPAMYAGSWYAADPAVLKPQLQKFLKQPLLDTTALQRLHAGNTPLDRPVLAIIAPHAGYMYSGAAAAHSYKALAGQPIKRVFLLGPSHRVPLEGAALPLAKTFQTPLGDLPVDENVVSRLKKYPAFIVSEEVHKVEHSLEMQLPFIKEALGNVKIVPIVIGKLNNEAEARLIAEYLRSQIAPGDLVIVSSDFTHFGPRYDYQPFTRNIKDNLRKLDSRAFSYINNCNLAGFMQFHNETHDTICGFYPICVLMSLLPATAHSSLLEYYTSSDVTQDDPDNSVSYMAIAFSGGSWAKSTAQPVSLSLEEQKSLLKLSRTTLEAFVNGKPLPAPPKEGIKLTSALRSNRGVFVTLYKHAAGTGGTSMPAANSKTSASLHDSTVRHKHALRGCIGYIWPLKPLHQAVIDNTVSACSKDLRFTPVEPHELKDIEIEISVLTPPRRVPSYQNIALGKDGIVMYKDGHQSVFLPFVPTEFGWNLEKTLEQLSLKAGLSEDAWKSGAEFDVFQAQVFEEAR
jgi:MEMO1 family protein